MKLISLNIGQPSEYQWNGQTIQTSIFKSPVTDERRVAKLGIYGDTQSDLRVHGGVDKAIYAYGRDALDLWKTAHPHLENSNGLVGENFTLDQLDETQVFVGDIFKIGSCELQAVQPRQPCFKLEIRLGQKDAVKMFIKINRPGVYFRVLNEGKIQVGQDLVRLQEDSAKVSIQELFEFYISKKMTSERAREILKAKALNESWKKKFEALA